MRQVAVSAVHPPVGSAEAKEISRAKAEIAVRTTLALACTCFVIVGIPLGIQSHRRESSAGLAISLAVAGAFYFFCITGESLSKDPAFHAHWFIGSPIIACMILSCILVKKQN
jgi:lipopolysaccharide export system permease protein